MPDETDDFLIELFSVEIPVDVIQHAYDPQKAREYYLRTRELKGRQKAAVEVGPGRRRAALTPSQVHAAKVAEALRRKKATEARVAELKARLEKLDKLLKELVKQAKTRSGVDSKKTSSESDHKNSKPQTEAQKKESAKRAKEYRDKQAKQAPVSEVKQLEAKIASVKKRIAKMNEQIAAAKKKSKSKTAPKGR